MHLKTRNVNTAFKDLVHIFNNDGHTYYGQLPIVKRPSRNGNVMVIDEPIIITYSHPKERVLFNSARDANPFFHVYEALWMLAGRNDVASVAYYAKQMGEYSDDGKTLSGAYGHRWRKYPNRLTATPAKLDQLDILVEHLKSNPTSRRAVLQMWNVEDDLMKIGGRCTCRPENNKGVHFPGCATHRVSKDTCCNLSVMFSLRHREQSHQDDGLPTYRQVIDMTVTNRSNDMIWGALGANYVHFSFLQEYMAARLQCEVGVYNHFSNNMHVYDWNWKPKEWLEDQTPDHYTRHEVGYLPQSLAADLWGKSINTIPLVKDPEVFDEEVQRIVAGYCHEDTLSTTWQEPFLQDIAAPMLLAFLNYREHKQFDDALELCGHIKADDWRIVATKWVLKRKEKQNAAAK